MKELENSGNNAKAARIDEQVTGETAQLASIQAKATGKRVMASTGLSSRLKASRSSSTAPPPAKASAASTTSPLTSITQVPAMTLPPSGVSWTFEPDQDKPSSPEEPLSPTTMDNAVHSGPQAIPPNNSFELPFPQTYKDCLNEVFALPNRTNVACRSSSSTPAYISRTKEPGNSKNKEMVARIDEQVTEGKAAVGEGEEVTKASREPIMMAARTSYSSTASLPSSMPLSMALSPSSLPLRSMSTAPYIPSTASNPHLILTPPFLTTPTTPPHSHD